MKGVLPALALNTIILLATAVQADQLSPTPEAGLWRSETRFMVNGEDYQYTIRSKPPAASPELDAMAPAIATSGAGTRMECITPRQAAEMVTLQAMQRKLQREVPECDLSFSLADRSRVLISGDCKGEDGFFGPLQGELEIITSYEIRSEFSGRGHIAVSGEPSRVSDTDTVDLQQSEILRWTAADCGPIAPSERLSF